MVQMQIFENQFGFRVMRDGDIAGRLYNPKWNSDQGVVRVDGEPEYIVSGSILGASRYVTCEGDLMFKIVEVSGDYTFFDKDGKIAYRTQSSLKKGFSGPNVFVYNSDGQCIFKIIGRWSWKLFEQVYTVECREGYGNTAFDVTLVLLAFRYCRENSDIPND